MQRGLIFDFPEDPQLWNVADEFMFGTALLVTPFVSNASSTSREVYFPKGSLALAE
jgi:alpha-D-xyloside xylohydrolase